jgi:rhodanese-related sulfurtransferase
MTTINTVQELKTRLDLQDPNDVLLDVRSEGEFQDGHITGAINLNVTNMFHFISEIKKLDKTKNYIVYCLSGNRSGMASMIMEQNKLNVCNVKVGFPAWASAGYEVSIGE